MRRSALDKYICELEGLPALSREALEALQLRRLNELLSREKARGGFYRGLPAGVGSLAELSALPFTTAEELSATAPGLLLTSQAEVERIISGVTSGTTGPAKRVFYTRRDLEHTVGFFAAGISEFTSPGDSVLIAMPFSGPDGLGELICRAVASLGANPVRAGVGRSLGELAGLTRRFSPAAYIGMSVPLLGLLRYMGRSSLSRALVSGDACPEGVCAGIERLLGTRLFPHYGSREMCLGGAVTCAAHSGMHIRENHILVEIVDENGRVLPDGERGELVITTLDMEAMPLIRYRTGDVARIVPGPCACGCVCRRLERVSRAEDVMERLDSALFRLPGLVDYRASLGPDGALLLDAVGSVRAGQLEEACAALGFAARAKVRPVSAGFRGSYPGKRSLTEAAAAQPV